MKVRSICLVVLSCWALSAHAGVINLGTANSFAVLAGTTVTNTGATYIHGDLGVGPGSEITGFPPGIVSGGTYSANALVLQAKNDLTTAYVNAAGAACGSGLTGQNLGGQTLTPGVYCFTSAAQLTGTLTLDTLGDPNAAFLFQIGSALTTANSSSVIFSNGKSDNIYWQVGSSATLGTYSTFAGNILALSSIDLDTGAKIEFGRALARNGAVTLHANDVSFETSTVGSAVPEPGTATLLSMGLLLSLIVYYRRQLRRSKRV